MTVIKNDVKNLVRQIMMGYHEYNSAEARSLVLPPEIQKEWIHFCDAKEDPLSHKAPKDMTPREKEEIQSRSWYNFDDMKIFNWTYK